MFRPQLSFFRSAVLAAAAVVLFTGESHAQRYFYYNFPGGPFGGPFSTPLGGGPFGGGPIGGGYRPLEYYPAYTPTYSFGPSWYSSSTYYIPVASSQSTDLSSKTANIGEKAAIEVKVPANAKVWFDGAETAQKGTDRYFSTPALLRGKAYSYEVRATWTTGDGRPMSETRQVTVEPGKWSVVDFLSGS